MGDETKKKKKKKEKKIKKVNKFIQHIGVISAYFTIAQAFIWMGLSIFGIIAFTMDLGTSTIGVSFEGVYLNFRMATSSPSCVVKPVIFLIICSMYLFLALSWFVICYLLLRTFKNWNDMSRIRKMSRAWVYVTTTVCIVDFILFVLFLMDFLCIRQHYADKYHYTRPTSKRPEYYLNSGEAMRRLHTDIEKMKGRKDYTPLMNKTMQNKTFENRINPFLQHISWSNTSWPTRSNITEEKDFVISEKNDTQIRVKHEGTHHEKSTTMKWAGSDLGEYTPTFPPIILMAISIKAIVVWIANIAFIIYFSRNVKNMIRKDKRGGFFKRLFRKCFKRKKVAMESDGYIDKKYLKKKKKKKKT